MVLRNSSLFDIYSEPGKGTILLSRYWTGVGRGDLPARPLEIGAISLPIEGEVYCGGGWAVEQTELRSLVLVSDGIGHGIQAAEASREAEDLFRKNKASAPAVIIEALHVGLKGTRGAAIAVAEIDHINRLLRYAGIGNIAGKIVTNEIVKNMVSHNGTAGRDARKIQEFTYPWDDESILVMNSDGLATGLHLTPRPQLFNRHQTIMAAFLYRDYVRGRDDATVLVAKKRCQQPDQLSAEGGQA